MKTTSHRYFMILPRTITDSRVTITLSLILLLSFFCYILLWLFGKSGDYLLQLSLFNELLNHFSYSGKPLSTYSSDQILGAAGRVLVSTHALILSSFSILLFFQFRKQDLNNQKGKILPVLSLIVLNGVFIRLALAYTFFGNYDMSSYEIVAEIAAHALTQAPMEGNR